MKNKAALLSLMAMAMAGMDYGSGVGFGGERIDPKLSGEDIISNKKKNHEEYLKKQGVQKYQFGEFSCFARNEENAKRKYENYLKSKKW